MIFRGLVALLKLNISIKGSAVCICIYGITHHMSVSKSVLLLCREKKARKGVCACMHAFDSVYVHMYVCVCGMSLSMCVCVCSCVCNCVVCICVCMYVCICVHFTYIKNGLHFYKWKILNALLSLDWKPRVLNNVVLFQSAKKQKWC